MIGITVIRNITKLEKIIYISFIGSILMLIFSTYRHAKNVAFNFDPVLDSPVAQNDTETAVGNNGLDAILAGSDAEKNSTFSAMAILVYLVLSNLKLNLADEIYQAIERELLMLPIRRISIGPPAEPLHATDAHRKGFITVVTAPIEEHAGNGSHSSYSLAGCPCQRVLPLTTDHGTLLVQGKKWQRLVPRHSICSDAASARGPGQKVVSYSFYGDWSDPYIYKRYFKEIEDRAVDIKKWYPEFLMRVYHNLPPVGLGWDSLCKLRCQYPHLDLCSVTDLPAPWGDLSYINGRMWRFLAMMDPLVDVALSRDLDSWVQHREEAVVREWLASNISCHMIRDHPKHGLVLAGLWGARLDIARGPFYYSVGLMLSQPRAEFFLFNGADQFLMAKLLWPYFVDHMMVHDAYKCGEADMHGRHGVRPFLTRREGQVYVGYGPTKGTESTYVTVCPEQCRPPQHPDWDYC